MRPRIAGAGLFFSRHAWKMSRHYRDIPEFAPCHFSAIHTALNIGQQVIRKTIHTLLSSPEWAGH
jgi:hypothetical protein